MLIESLLPLGRLDPGLREPETPLHIADFATGAAQAEEVGLDAVLVEETKDDPYQLLALGAAATSTIGLGTSVAMVFPRSPTVTAMSAWSLQKLSGGRFVGSTRSAPPSSSTPRSCRPFARERPGPDDPSTRSRSA
ncbi:MAG: LLM class flavin-dependent oxidoreductase [Acidimicrobiales bacterium]